MFEIEGKPVGKGRPRFWNGHAVTPQATRDYEKRVALAYKECNLPLFETEPLEVEIIAKYPIPKQTRKAEKALMMERKIIPTKKPDIDNIAKIILDGLNGVAYKDDNQVCRLSVRKEYTNSNGSVLVAVRSIDITE